MMDAASLKPSAEHMDALVKEARRRQTVTGLVVALIIHGLLGLGLALFALPLLPPKEPSLIVAAPTIPSTTPHPERTVTPLASPERPAAPSSAANAVVTANRVTPVAVPQIEEMADMAVLGINLGEGVGFGAGLGSGAGLGLGSTTFFGNQSDGNRIAFVVDVSASMSNDQFTLMKAELTRSLMGLSPGTRYQVIFFSGPVWFAGQRVNREGRHRAVIDGPRGKKLVWESADGSADGFRFADGQQPLPAEPWRTASPGSIRQTTRDVDAVGKSFGTSWHMPLQMALSMDPKPDVIYFMTDGAVRDAATAVKDISQWNRRGGKKAKIFTTAMMEPKAAEQLYELARKNGGSFSKVLKDGTIVSGRKALP